MSGPGQYRVTVDVEAWQWSGSGTDAILEWVADNGGRAWLVPQLSLIRIAGGNRYYAVRVGDWIIRGTTGEFFAMDPDGFAKTYEAVTTV